MFSVQITVGGTSRNTSRPIRPLHAILDLYYAMSMGHPLLIRPVTWYFLIGVILLGGIMFRTTQQENSPFPPPSKDTIWHEIGEKHNHPLLTWEQSLRNRPIREEIMDLSVFLDVGVPLAQPDIDREIPVFTGSITAKQILWTNEDVGSGSLSFQGIFFLPASISGSMLTGKDIDLPTTFLVSAHLQFLRSGTTTRWYLDDITLNQSGTIHEFPLIARAFLQEYEDVWIKQDNASSSLRDLQTFALYQKLTHQIDQHLISTASGTTQLLIDGPERGIDAVLNSDGKATIQLRFPEQGLRSTIQEIGEDETYSFSLTHYRVPTPLFAGALSFVPSGKSLKSQGQRSGAHNSQLTYTGSHTFSIHPIPVFSITLPEQVRSWEEIVAGRKTAPQQE